MIALIAFTKRGCELGRRLAQDLSGQLWTTDRLAEETGLPGCGSLGRWTGERFSDCEALVFVSASGIAVRAIAPFVKDKFSDPAVVSVDEAGRFAVPLLSGHVGGANDLARRIAAITGGQAAVSTATDVNGLFAVDQWAREQGLVIVERSSAKQVSAALLEGQPVGLVSAYPIAGTMPRGLVTVENEGEKRPGTGIVISLTATEQPFDATLHLVPRVITLGVGCRRGAPREQLEAGLSEFLEQNAIPAQAVCGLATIDLKKEEPGLLAMAAQRGWPVTCFAAEELAEEEGAFAPSAFVQQITGVDNVCQRAAQRAGGTVFVPKTVCHGATFAAAAGSVSLTWETQEDRK